MFDLNDSAIEEIIFAMEDQETDTLISLETGEVIPAEDGVGDGFASPPEWSSRDGFRLMEEFQAGLRQLSARRELGAALARGRGVFKHFKSVLAAYPEVELAFREYKSRAMRRKVTEWFDKLREAEGLVRLGPEPEDAGDLLESDFSIKVTPLRESVDLILALVDRAETESSDLLPALISAYEFWKLRAELESATEGICAWVEDGEGGSLGAAIALRHRIGERCLGRINFAYVIADFRGMGLGSALLEKLRASLASEGIHLTLLDSALLPGEFLAKLASGGFKPFGGRAFSDIGS